MPCGTFTIDTVPEDQLQEILDLFKANQPAPISVTSAADGAGTYTVTAVFPPCPPNTQHTPGELVGSLG